jgi:hypothetical protein
VRVGVVMFASSTSQARTTIQLQIQEAKSIDFIDIATTMSKRLPTHQTATASVVRQADIGMEVTLQGGPGTQSDAVEQNTTSTRDLFSMRKLIKEPLYFLRVFGLFPAPQSRWVVARRGILESNSSAILDDTNRT